MNSLDILLHLLSFIAPALALAVLMPLTSRLLIRKPTRLLGWLGQMGVNFIVGLAALMASVWWFDRDGKMMGYLLLVVAVATSQWLLMRGWRR